MKFVTANQMFITIIIYSVAQFLRVVCLSLAILDLLENIKFIIQLIRKH